MFYWLKLIRAFDERLSILVKQGKVRSGVYTGIGQEAIIVGTVLRAAEGRLHLPAAPRSRLVSDEGRRRADVMMSQMFAKTTGLSKGRDSALHSGVPELGIFGNTSMLGANLPVACRPRATPSRWRRWTTSSSPISARARATSATSTRRSTSPACSGCRSSSSARTTSTRTRCRSRRAWRSTTWRIGRQGYGFDGVAINGNDVLAVYQATQGALARARGGEGPDADRVQDVPLARTLRARQGVLPHERRARDVEEPRSDPDVHDVPRRACTCCRRQAEGDRERVSRRRSTTRSSSRRTRRTRSPRRGDGCMPGLLVNSAE